MGARKLILRNAFSAGDIVLLTAAVRDLHRCYPGQFVTDVRTSCAELWENNPYLTPLPERGVEILECEYPLINEANQTPCHVLHGFTEFLNAHLGLRIRLTEFRGDIHLSAREKFAKSPVAKLTGNDAPFWLVVAGGKYDYTIKWWSPARFQAVVDHFRGRIQFVQVGAAAHAHPRLSGVIDLRGRTDLRQLLRLVYHAQGALCPVTAVMHMAAAVETKTLGHRPCVVVAGGREPPTWEAYPGHQFIHTVGALPCCAHGACWRSRTAPLGDGDELDYPQHLCLQTVGDLPRCMDLISPEEVIRRVESYFQGGALSFLSPAQARAANGLATAR
jgi:ADP-heptose:LPS heptosyltransferase